MILDIKEKDFLDRSNASTLGLILEKVAPKGIVGVRIPGDKVKALFMQRGDTGDFLDWHIMYDNRVDEHFLLLRYLDSGGKVFEVMALGYKVPELGDLDLEKLDLSAQAKSIGFNVPAGQEVCWEAGGVSYTLTAERIDL